MEDKLLTLMFQPERWERALNIGLDKDISMADLRKLNEPDTRIQLYRQIKGNLYNIIPPHAQLIPKDKPGEYRTVYINENVDRILLSIANEILFETCPDMVHPACKSYQTGIGCGKIVQECSRKIAKANGKVIGWKADLSKYFDSVPIEFIDLVFDEVEKRNGKSVVINMLRRYYHQNICFDTNGNVQQKYMSLMQGCAVASFLADALLYEMDKRMTSLDEFYVRYSDDTLYIGRNYSAAMEIMCNELSKRGLKLNPKKVEYLDSNHWFKFLGFSIRGADISISKGRLDTFQKEIEGRTIKRRNVTLRKATKDVVKYLYVGDGTYSWATSVLPIVTNEHDINELNKFVLDCLKGVATNHRKVGGLGYQKEGKYGVVIRGKGSNVKENRHKVSDKIPGYLSIGMMRKAILTSKETFETLVRCEL